MRAVRLKLTRKSEQTKNKLKLGCSKVKKDNKIVFICVSKTIYIHAIKVILPENADKLSGY